VPREQGFEGDFCTWIVPGGEPLEELSVAHPRNGTAVEEQLKLHAHRSRRLIRHGRGPVPTLISLLR
jgi:hypothetical protein